MGRDALLEELRQQLWELPLGEDASASPTKSQTKPPKKPKVLVLVGQGGIGKTSLAVKLLEAVGADCEAGTLRPDCPYDGILVLSARQGIGFDEVVRELTQALELPENDGVAARETIDTILRGLQRQRWLLVFDNWEDALYPATHPQAGRTISPELGQLLNALAYRPHSSQVILTSREMPKDLADERDELGLPDPMLVAVRQVDGISEEASVELLRQRGLRDSEADLHWVARRVGGQVLVLALLANLAWGKPGMLRQKPELVTQRAAPVVRAQLERHPEAARELLQRMCVLRAGVDLRGLTFLRVYRDARKRRFGFLPKFKSAPGVTQKTMEETKILVEQLVETSLVQKQFDEKKIEDYYDLHRVIAEVVRETCRGELPVLMQTAYAFYCTDTTVEPKTLEDLQPALEAQYFAFELGNYTEAETLIYRLEKYLEPWGHWTLLKELYEQILPHLDEESQPYILQRLGSRYRSWGDWQQAEAYYREALRLAQGHGNRGLIACLWRLLGEIEQNRGSWEAAESFYRQCLAVEQELGDRAGMAYLWGVLGYIQRNRGNWDEAETLYRQCLAVEEELGDREGMASSWASLGYIQRNRGNWDEAETLLRQSLPMREELGDRAGIAATWECLGEIEQNRGNRDEAETLYRQSLQLREELGDREGIASSWASLGEIERNRGNWDEAESLYRQSLQLREELGDREGIASSWVFLGYIEQCRGNWDEAQTLFRQSLQMYEELGHREGMASLWGVLGDIQRNRGNWDEAESLYRQSLQMREELGDREGMASSIAGLGENELERGNLDAAEALLKDALERMETLGMTDNIAETNWDLAQLYRDRGNSDLAQQHYTNARTLFKQLGAVKDLEKIDREWNGASEAGEAGGE